MCSYYEHYNIVKWRQLEMGLQLYNGLLLEDFINISIKTVGVTENITIRIPEFRLISNILLKRKNFRDL